MCADHACFGLVVEGAMAIGAGIGLRLFSAFLLAREGVSLTGFEVGDPFPFTAEET